nr:hypothetical protein CFP56_19418 [Quercus suber]
MEMRHRMAWGDIRPTEVEVGGAEDPFVEEDDTGGERDPGAGRQSAGNDQTGEDDAWSLGEMRCWCRGAADRRGRRVLPSKQASKHARKEEWKGGKRGSRCWREEKERKDGNEDGSEDGWKRRKHKVAAVERETANAAEADSRAWVNHSSGKLCGHQRRLDSKTWPRPSLLRLRVAWVSAYAAARRRSIICGAASSISGMWATSGFPVVKRHSDGLRHEGRILRDGRR